MAAVALAVGLGHTVAAGHYTVSTLAIAAAAWGAYALRIGVLAGGLVVLAVLLPIYNATWLESIAPGVGIFTLVLALVALPVLRRLTPTGMRWVAVPGLATLIVFGAVVCVSLIVSAGDQSFSLAKTLLARAVALPIIIVAGWSLLDVRERRDTLGALTGSVVAVGLLGSALSVIQVGLGRGYISLGASDEAIAQFVGKRATGLSEHPGTWAAFLLIPLSLAGTRWIRTNSLGWGFATFTLAGGVVLSGLRAGWLALVLLAIGGAGIARGRTRLVVAAVLFAALLLPLVLGNFRVHLAGGNPAKGEIGLFQGRLGNDESARLRILLTRAEIELGVREPLTGVGLGNVGPSLRSLDVSYLENQQLLAVGAPVDRHNSYAGLFAELGLPGVLAFVFAIVLGGIALVRAGLATDDTLVSSTCFGLTGALMGTAVLAAFSDADRLVIVWWLLGTAFACDALRRRDFQSGTRQ